MDGSAQAEAGGVNQVQEEARGAVCETGPLRKKFSVGVIEVSIVGILLSVLAAIYFYRIPFSGPLSNSADDWAAFGSYIGGVFGPLVSFVTLIAVLRTVYLQRELLDTQREQFVLMNALQQQTFNAQLNQMTGVAADARKARVSAYQSTVLQVLDQQIGIYERAYERALESATKSLQESQRTGDEEFKEIAQRSLVDRDRARTAIDMLAHLSVKISVSEYREVDGVKKEFLEGLDNIKNATALEK